MSKLRQVLAALLFIAVPCTGQTTHVTLTYYQPVVAQCNKDCSHTADGSEVKLHHIKSGKARWCAISRDLMYLFRKSSDENIFADKKHPKKIWIEGFGVYEVRDLMNARMKHAVDIMIHPKNSKRIKLNNVKIKIVK